MTKKLQRHARIKPMSAKRHKVRYLALKPEREFIKFVKDDPDGGCCPICGREELILHHMVAGPNRGRALLVRAAWLAICNYCNTGEIEDELQWPIAKQLALKLVQDPEYFDLAEVNKLFAPEGHPNPPRRVTMTDVVKYLVVPITSSERPTYLRSK